MVGAKYGAGFHHQTDLIIRRSFTQGKTWEPFQMLFSPSAFYQNQTFGATVGTVLDRHTGTIWAMLTVIHSSVLDDYRAVQMIVYSASI